MKRQKIDFSESIIVHVGEEEKPYVLHKSLTISSGFFTAAFSGSWQEAASGAIKIRDFEPKHFDHYAEWLYTSEISLGALSDPPIRSSTDKNLGIHYMMLMDLYAMGYFLLDGAFRNCIVDTLLKAGDKFNMHPCHRCVDNVWDRIPQAAPLKDLIISHWANGITILVSIIRAASGGTSRKAPCSIC